MLLYLLDVPLRGLASPSSLMTPLAQAQPVLQDKTVLGNA